jgi:hypothetical protein
MDVLPYRYGHDSNGICWGYYVECYMKNDNVLTWAFDLVALPSCWRMSYEYSMNGNRALIEKEIERRSFKGIEGEVLGFIEESFQRVDEAMELMKSLI